MQAVLIVLMCVFAAILYGVAHDQITARVCVEYFTVGHPPVFDTDDPTLLGLGWGIIATWWVGLILSIPLEVAARAGPRPKRGAASLVKPIGGLLLVMAVFATVAGVGGYAAGVNGKVVLTPDLAAKLPESKWAAFQACAFAHSASYFVGFIGGGMMIVWMWISRGRAARSLTARR